MHLLFQVYMSVHTDTAAATAICHQMQCGPGKQATMQMCNPNISTHHLSDDQCVSPKNHVLHSYTFFNHTQTRTHEESL